MKKEQTVFFVGGTATAALDAVEKEVKRDSFNAKESYWYTEALLLLKVMRSRFGDEKTAELLLSDSIKQSDVDDGYFKKMERHQFESILASLRSEAVVLLSRKIFRPETFANNIEALLSSREIPKSVFESLIGVSPGYISRIAKGSVSTPSAEIVGRCAQVLEVDMDSLMWSNLDDEKLRRIVAFIGRLKRDTESGKLKWIHSETDSGKYIANLSENTYAVIESAVAQRLLTEKEKLWNDIPAVSHYRLAVRYPSMMEGENGEPFDETMEDTVAVDSEQAVDVFGLPKSCRTVVTPSLTALYHCIDIVTCRNGAADNAVSEADAVIAIYMDS